MTGYVATQAETMMIMSYANAAITEINRMNKQPYAMHKLFCVCAVVDKELSSMRILSLRDLGLVYPYDDKHFDSISELGFMDSYSFENQYIVRVQ